MIMSRHPSSKGQRWLSLTFSFNEKNSCHNFKFVGATGLEPVCTFRPHAYQACALTKTELSTLVCYLFFPLMILTKNSMYAMMNNGKIPRMPPNIPFPKFSLSFERITGFEPVLLHLTRRCTSNLVLFPLGFGACCRYTKPAYFNNNEFPKNHLHNNI